MKGARSIKPITQHGYAQSIGIGIIVTLDHVVIIGDEESGAVSACREKEIGFAGAGHRLPVGGSNTLPRPFVKGCMIDVIVKAVRNDDFKAPRQARLPTVQLQIIGRRGQGIRDIRPNILLAVAVKINGEFLEGGWHKLRLPHGARP